MYIASELPPISRRLLEPIPITWETLPWLLVSLVGGILLFGFLLRILARLQERISDRDRHDLIVSDNPDQRRASFRVLAHFPADLVTQGGTVAVPCQILDLSTGGAQIAAGRLFPPGSRFEIRFVFEDDPPETVLAEVVSAKTSLKMRHLPHQLHCRFSMASPAQQRHMEQIVAALERRILRSEEPYGG